MKTSESIASIAKALLEVQKEIGKVKKTAENPFYHSSYATLDDIIDVVKPICNKHGIVILQDINGCTVSTLLIHESGEWIQQEGLELPNEKGTAQGAGSAVTYGRRYSLSTILGIATETDDDGNTANDTASSGNRIDFMEIQKELSGINDVTILREYHTELMKKNMSDKQKYAINEMVGKRKKEVEAQDKIKDEFQGNFEL